MKLAPNAAVIETALNTLFSANTDLLLTEMYELGDVGIVRFNRARNIANDTLKHDRTGWITVDVLAGYLLGLETARVLTTMKTGKEEF